MRKTSQCQWDGGLDKPCQRIKQCTRCECGCLLFGSKRDGFVSSAAQITPAATKLMRRAWGKVRNIPQRKYGTITRNDFYAYMKSLEGK